MANNKTRANLPLPGRLIMLSTMDSKEKIAMPSDEFLLNHTELSKKYAMWWYPPDEVSKCEFESEFEDKLRREKEHIEKIGRKVIDEVFDEIELLHKRAAFLSIIYSLIAWGLIFQAEDRSLLLVVYSSGAICFPLMQFLVTKIWK